MKSLITTIFAVLAMAVPATAKPGAPASDHMGDPDMHAYILLDRTGSMQSIWSEALSSVNAYANALGQKEEGEVGDLDASVTLAVFDAQDGLQFDVLRRDQNPKAWSDVTDDEASPRGMTPLFDAISRIVAMAEGDKPEKAVLVIMTDGAENASREVTRDGVKAALDRVRDKGWEVVFLGAEFASFGDAESLGQSSSRNMAVSKDALQSSLYSLGRKSRSYGKGEEATVEFDAADREAADEDDVKQRKGQ